MTRPKLEVKDLNDLCHYLVQLQEILENKGLEQAALHLHKATNSLAGVMLAAEVKLRAANKRRNAS